MLAFFVPPPIRAGDFEELKVPDVFGGFDMPASAEIDKGIVGAIRHRGRLQVVDHLDFVFFPPRGPERTRFIGGMRAHFEGVVPFNDIAHPLFDFIQILRLK